MPIKTNTPELKRISHSQISTFLSCAYRWYLTYGLRLRPVTEEVAPATLGDIVHVGLAAGLKLYWALRRHGNSVTYDDLANNISIVIKAWDNEHRPTKTAINVVAGQVNVSSDADFYQQWDEMLETGKALAVRTLQNLRLIEDYDVVELAGEPLVEYWLTEDTGEFQFAGKVDAVLYNRTTGLTEVIDWKVRERFAGTESEQLNSQLGLYQHVLFRRGINAAASVVYQIKNALPTAPKLNKDGSMSRQRIVTDWATYRKALLEAGLDPADYEDMREKLSSTEFFRPLMVIRTPKVAAAIWDNLIVQARRIHNETEYPRSYGYPCRGCPFATWCIAELYGYDTTELLEVQYVIDESEVAYG